MSQPKRMAEEWLKALLRVFGATCVLAVLPFIMPRSWMGFTHEWLGMGTLPEKPVVEYLARSTSALCAFYGGLLFVLATDVHRYAPAITYQAIAMMLLSGAGAILGLRAGMPAWWMVGDGMGCWVFCGAMLWLQKRIADLKELDSDSGK
jgi:hypothetical protein